MIERRSCLCGGEWPACTADVPGGVWRSSPGLVTPWRQWCREKLPSSYERFVIASDDGFVRTWGWQDPLGYVKPLEIKTRNGSPGRKDIMTLKSIQGQRIAEAMIIRLQGNVPGELAHWPEPCECCGLPERLIVSEWIEANYIRVTEQTLIDLITRHPEEPSGQTKWWTV